MVEKRVKKFGQGPPAPTFRAMPERNRFFLWEVFPYIDQVFCQSFQLPNDVGQDESIFCQKPFGNDFSKGEAGGAQEQG